MNNPKMDEELKGLEINIKSEIEIKEEPIENHKEGFCDEENMNSNSLKPQEQTNVSGINKSSSLNPSWPVIFEVENCKMEIEDDYGTKMEHGCEDKTEKKIPLSIFKDEEIKFCQLESSEFPKVRKMNEEKKLLVSCLHTKNIERVKSLISKSYDGTDLKSIPGFNSDGNKKKVTQRTRKRFRCSECHFKADRKSIVERHKLNHSNSEIKLFKCEVCYFGTNYKQNLKFHLMKHTNERKSLRCSQCSYETNYPNLLKRHSLIHSTDKLFRCSECEYECNEKKQLRYHLLNRHSNQKEFQCSECSYASNSKGDINIHLLIHSEVKRFKCTECDYQTNYKDVLKSHLLDHVNIKLFKCEKCPYESNRRNHVNRHMLKHSDLKPFGCTKCSFKSRTKRLLGSHLLTHSSSKGGETRS